MTCQYGQPVWVRKVLQNLYHDFHLHFQVLWFNTTANVAAWKVCWNKNVAAWKLCCFNVAAWKLCCFNVAAWKLCCFSFAVLTSLLFNVAAWKLCWKKKRFSRGVLANTVRFLRFFSLESLWFFAHDGITDFGIAVDKHCKLALCSFVLQIDWSKTFSDGPRNNMWCKWVD